MWSIPLEWECAVTEARIGSTIGLRNSIPSLLLNICAGDLLGRHTLTMPFRGKPFWWILYGALADRYIKKIERRTSNIQHRTSNNDGTTLCLLKLANQAMGLIKRQQIFE
jgi:hypothetical protein